MLPKVKNIENGLSGFQHQRFIWSDFQMAAHDKLSTRTCFIVSTFQDIEMAKGGRKTSSCATIELENLIRAANKCVEAPEGVGVTDRNQPFHIDRRLASTDQCTNRNGSYCDVLTVPMTWSKTPALRIGSSILVYIQSYSISFCTIVFSKRVFLREKFGW